MFSQPVAETAFLPVEKRIKYVLPLADIHAVTAAASQDDQDHLWTIHDTLARMGEINRLTRSDVDLTRRTVVLHTRKKKGGHLTPRKAPMTERLFDVLSRRGAGRDPEKPWVFWRACWSRKEARMVTGFHLDRKSLKPESDTSASTP